MTGAVFWLAGTLKMGVARGADDEGVGMIDDRRAKSWRPSG
jgi:hypothetical protein